MAIYRTISMSFWTDNKVVDDFTPEDKYFYLYLFTNPHTNLCGCYEVSIKQMTYETGYSMDTIERLIKRFEEDHNVIRFSKQTKELLLLNWHKYNWTTSERFRKPLLKEISEVKCEEFKRFLQNLADGKEPIYGIDTTCIDTNCTDTTVTVTDIYNNTIKGLNTSSVEDINSNLEDINNNNNTTTNITTNTSNTTTNTSTEKKKEDPEAETIEAIIGYLNTRVGSNYRPNTYETVKLIHGRLKEGRTLDDFKYVIDVKAEEWMGTSQEQYLRPKTLFAQSNFENYLQQRKGVKKKQGKSSRSSREPIDWDELNEWARQRDEAEYANTNGGVIIHDE